VAISTARDLLSEEERQSMKASIMATEYPRLALAGIFEKVKQFGAGYVEVVVPRNMRRKDLPELQRLMDQTGIGVSCVTPMVEMNKPGLDVKASQELLIEGIHLAREIGVEMVCTYFGGNSARGKDEAVETYVRNIAPCLREAETCGVTIVLENEYDYDGRDVSRTPEGCLDILSAVDSPNFKLNFDTGNFYVGGVEPYPYAYELLKEHIRYIHAKDAVRYSPRLYGPRERLQVDQAVGEFLCVPLGEGAINFESFIARLKQDHYPGFLSVEPHTQTSDLDETFRKGMAYLKARGIGN